MARGPRQQEDGRSGAGRQDGPAFLLAQLGAHAAALFARRLQALELVPAHAGILRILSGAPGSSQRGLARALGALPSRLVTLIDELAAKGLVERKPDPEDRRNNLVLLTAAGERVLKSVGEIARAHQAELLAGLTCEQQETLTALLRIVAVEQGMIPGVHPGYR